MLWNVISLLSIIVVPGAFAAVALAAAMGQTREDTQPIERPRRPIGSSARER